MVRVEGKLVNHFIPIEAVLDDHVGERVRFEVERGGTLLEVEIEVEDLHAITPSAYLEVGDAVLNDLSYQSARSFGVPITGVSIASPGYIFSRAGIPRGALISEVDGEPVADLRAFAAALAKFPDGARVPIRFAELRNPDATTVAVIYMDRKWFGMRYCERDDRSGRWPCVDSPTPPSPMPLAPATTSYAANGDKRVRALAPSLVLVDYDIPYFLDGVHSDRFQGCGLVVDAERGLVVVDRETVPIAMGDLNLTFAGSVEVPGRLVYLHPEHNLAVIAYDPALLGETPVRAAELSSDAMEVGDSVWLVGLSPRHKVVSRKTEISRIEPIALPLTHPPRFRERNLELMALADETSTLGGVLTDKKSRVVAYWAAFSSGTGKTTQSFFAGIPSRVVLEVIEPLREGRAVGRRSLGVELYPLTLAQARNRGLSDADAKKFEKQPAGQRRVLAVVRTTKGFPAAKQLREGDLLLAINGETVTSFEAVEAASEAKTVKLTILRDREPIELDLPSKEIDGRGTERALLWAGALLQSPHLALSAQHNLPRRGVYVARFRYGSPANRYGLRATRRIVQVDGEPVRDLDAFIEAVRDKRDRESVRLKTIDLDGKVAVITLKLDLQFWPTFLLDRDDNGWTRTPVAPTESAGAAGS